MVVVVVERQAITRKSKFRGEKDYTQSMCVSWDKVCIREKESEKATERALSLERCSEEDLVLGDDADFQLCNHISMELNGDFEITKLANRAIWHLNLVLFNFNAPGCCCISNVSNRD